MVLLVLVVLELTSDVREDGGSSDGIGFHKTLVHPVPNKPAAQFRKQCSLAVLVNDVPIVLDAACHYCDSSEWSYVRIQNEIACWQTKRTLVGCTDPLLRGLVHPISVLELKKLRSGWWRGGGCHWPTEFPIAWAYSHMINGFSLVWALTAFISMRHRKAHVFIYSIKVECDPDSCLSVCLSLSPSVSPCLSLCLPLSLPLCVSLSLSPFLPPSLSLSLCVTEFTQHIFRTSRLRLFT